MKYLSILWNIKFYQTEIYECFTDCFMLYITAADEQLQQRCKIQEEIIEQLETQLKQQELKLNTVTTVNHKIIVLQSSTYIVSIIIFLAACCSGKNTTEKTKIRRTEEGGGICNTGFECNG